MTFKLRPYQQAAVDAAKEHMSRSLSSFVIEAATGAGKSLIVAEIAKWLFEKSGKKVLCLQPTKELVEQNYIRYLAYGNPASIWSASAGKKCLRHNVVFGTPKSVHNSLDKFGAQFAAVIVDEAHTTSPTVKEIINHIRNENPNLRVGGLTATPYRMNTGYIYGIDQDNRTLEEDETVNPFYDKLIYRITAHELVSQGFLTPPVADAAISERYDTSGLIIKSNGQFDSSTIEQAFEGKGRKTAAIVSEVVALSAGKMGVMLFGATVQHCHEIMASLPPENSRMVIGSTSKKEREQIINDFKEMKFKYIVSAGVLTTGFDAPHVDVVAILRATESASLLQQIIGRGLRLHDNKLTCLVLDYAENIERHELEDDMFTPKIKTSIGGSGQFRIEALCRCCGFVNDFSGRPNPDNFEVDQEGYFVDLAGKRIEAEIGGQPMPAHFGRRCKNTYLDNNFQYVRCGQRWSLKECPECDAENDIAARYCKECRAELVDPNTSLVLEFKKMKSDPKILSTDKVVGWKWQEWHSQKGNRSIRVDYTTEYRTFSTWYTPDSNNIRSQSLWRNFCEAVFGPSCRAETIDNFIAAMNAGQGAMPETVTARKEGDFFKVFMHNQPEDKAP